ncbi:WD40-repeat-containing domain protein [Cubamyces lactineus]|nr:WD40-repeat-containing domain protein [Cubamyces lactineus]
MYSTIAVFAPLDTPIRRLAAANVRTSVSVRVGLENTWSDTLVSRVTDGSYIAAITLSPDGIYIACGHKDGTAQLLNAHTGTELRAFKGNAKEPIRSLSFSPTGKELLSGSHYGSVDLWDVETGANLNTWKAHSASVNSVAWLPDGTLAASASADNTIGLWRVASSETMVVLQVGDMVLHVVFAPDGDLLYGSHDKMCKILNTRGVDWGTEADIEPTQTLKHDSRVCTVAVSSDSRLVACGLYDGEIVLWTKSDGQRLRSLPGQSDVTSLAFYPSGLLAAAYYSSPITLWDVSTGAPVKRAGNEGARAAAFASDSLHIAHAIGCEFRVCLWPSELKQNAARTTAITGSLKQLAWCSSVEDRKPVESGRTGLRAAATSPTGKLVLAEYDHGLRIYEVPTGRCMRTIDYSSGMQPSAVWSSTGRLFACAGLDGAVRVWKADSGKHVRTFAGYSGQDHNVVFTHDEQHVLFPSWDGIRQGKIGSRTASEVLFQSAGDQIRALAVSSDRQWILSSCCRHSSPPNTSSADLLAHPSRQPVKSDHGWYYALRLHNATSGHVVWIEHHPHCIISVAFSEDCTRALAGNWAGEVFLYDLTQIIPPDPTVLRSPPPLSVPEHKLSVRETQRDIKHISFSPNGRAVISDRIYTSIPSELRPLHTTSADPSLSALAFYDGDWLWHINYPDSDPRRLCWIPPMFHPLTDSIGLFSSANGQVITYITMEGSLVVMDGASTR